MNHLRATLTAKISSSINPDLPGRVFFFSITKCNRRGKIDAESKICQPNPALEVTICPGPRKTPRAHGLIAVVSDRVSFKLPQPLMTSASWPCRNLALPGSNPNQKSVILNLEMQTPRARKLLNPLHQVLLAPLSKVTLCQPALEVTPCD